MDKASRYIQHNLLKEAEDRTKNKKTFDKQIPFAKELLHEAESRLQRIKTASLEKEAMAQQANAGDLRNSSSNTRWYPPNISPRVAEIQQEIEAAFRSYFQERISGQNTEFEAGARFAISNDSKEILVPDGNETVHYPSEPDATLAIRFVYKRHIRPINDERFSKNSEQAIGLVDKALSQYTDLQGRSFNDFIEALHELNIPLHSFFQSTYGSEDVGAISSTEDIKALQEFILREQKRHQRPLVLPDGTVINGSERYLSNHAERIEGGETLQPTSYEKRKRKYRNKDLPIEHPTDKSTQHGRSGLRTDRSRFPVSPTSLQIASAIGDKVRRGYWINYKDLRKFLNKQREAWLDFHGYPKRSKQHPKTISYTKYYNSMFDRIVQYMDQGCYPAPQEEPESKWTGFGTHPETEESMRGFEVGNLSQRGRRTKHSYCVNLTDEELSYILYHMTTESDWGPQSKQKGAVGPDEFSVPNHSMKYQSNGWDSSPTDPSDSKPLIPAVKKIEGRIVYDTDQVNMGRHHLVKYGQAIETLIRDGWGEWCDKVLKALRDPAKQYGHFVPEKDTSPNRFPHDAWANIIGNQSFGGNRTNAETVLDVINHFSNKSYADFVSFLETSLAEQTERGKRETSGGVKRTDESTIISPHGFESFKRYGYQISKMMDFIYALMARCCEEPMSNRQGSKGEAVQENFFGRGYTASTGKAGYGYVMVGVKYAFNAQPIGNEDEARRKIVNTHRGRRGVKSDTEIQRATDWGQHGTPVAPDFQHAQLDDKVVMESLQYFIGEANSESRWFKTLITVPSWREAMNELYSRFPAIRDEMDVLIEPINIDLQKLEQACKNGLAAAQKEITDMVHSNVDPTTGQPIAQKIDSVVTLETSSGEKSADGRPITYVEVVDAYSEDAQNAVLEDVDMQIDAPDVQDAQGNILPEDPVNTQVVNPSQNVPQTNIDPQYDVPQEAETEEKKPFPMPSPEYLDPNKVTKRTRETGKLTRNRPDPFSGKIHKGSLVERLIKAADKMDRLGLESISTRIDILISKMLEKNKDA